MLRLQAAYFVAGAPAGVIVGEPALSDLDQAREWLHQALVKLGREPRGIIVDAAWRGELTYDRRRGFGASLLTRQLPFQDGFRLRVFETLAALAGERCWLKFCAASTCSRPFVAKRHDADTCSSTCRSTVWRAAYRDAVNKARRARYRLDQESRHGRRIKIQKRQSLTSPLQTRR